MGTYRRLFLAALQPLLSPAKNNTKMQAQHNHQLHSCYKLFSLWCNPIASNKIASNKVIVFLLHAWLLLLVLVIKLALQKSRSPQFSSRS